MVLTKILTNFLFKLDFQTSLYIFLLDVNFEKSTIKLNFIIISYIVSNFKKINDQIFKF